ncbi:uncharacterized protein LOC144010536 [Festucalex cinctus]
MASGAVHLMGNLAPARHKRGALVFFPSLGGCRSGVPRHCILPAGASYVAPQDNLNNGVVHWSQAAGVSNQSAAYLSQPVTPPHRQIVTTPQRVSCRPDRDTRLATQNPPRHPTDCNLLLAVHYWCTAS